MSPWFQPAQCGHQAWIGLSGPNVPGQAHYYQSWRCNWGPGWYHEVVLCAETAGSFQAYISLSQQRGHLGDQGSWDSNGRPDAVADVTMSSAGWAFTWNMEGLVTLGLSWCQETQWYFLGTFSVVKSERWAPSECNYRNNSLILLLWLILKSSLSVAIDCFGSLAIHIPQKNLFAKWLRRKVPNWHHESSCCGQASSSCWNT